MNHRPALVLSALSALGIGFAAWSSLVAADPAVASTGRPPAPAFAQRLAGSGVVEPRGEIRALGSEVAGTVQAVLVTPGQAVEAGAVLVRLDDRTARARLSAAQAALALAQARCARLEALPRAEDLPPAQARVDAAQAAWREAEDLRARAERMVSTGAVSDEDLTRRTAAAAAAAARLREAEAALALLRAGAWAPDLAIARAEVTAAQAEVATAQVDLDRRTITTPTAGTVLRVDTRPGEPATPGGPSLVSLGDTSVLMIRADLDEQDAWRLRDGAPGMAIVRGQPSLRHALVWDRAEPVIRPKRSLTGDSGERIDTRVVQVLFRLTDPGQLRIGQQVDVQVDAAP